jgi:uncharacterized protein YacL
MFDAIIVILFILAFGGVGYDSLDALPTELVSQVSNLEGFRVVVAGFGALIGLGIGLVAQTSYRRVERQVRAMPIDVLSARAIGLLAGLLAANLILAPIYLFPFPVGFAFLKPLLAILGSIVFCYLGVSLADTHGVPFLRLVDPRAVERVLVAEGTLRAAKTKVIDTSCIIDGRIEDLLQTGFLEGQLLVPQFIVRELQLLADAANDMKRSRGRRGLDILNRLKDKFSDRITVHTSDYQDITSIDMKLLKFASEIQATLLTNDYNLSKVATLQQIPTLNLNDLAQSLRPIYLPGDSIEVKIIKEGKEAAQGVGYLDDGTMVVVEEGQKYLGKMAGIVVTSALQTAAGRMIFAKLPQ